MEGRVMEGKRMGVLKEGQRMEGGKATSPNGNPNFQNVVNWSGSLGVGKKPPEEGQTLEEE